MIDLGIIFKPLTALINKRITEQTPARELAESLDGHVMAIRVDNTGLAIFLAVEHNQLHLRTRYEEDPDVVLSGSPISLITLAGSDPESVIRDGHVTMSGDALIGEKFQRLLRFAQPDIEDELANVVGDVVANQASSLARGIGNAAGQVSDRLHNRFSDYLTKDRGALPTPEHFQGFRDDVEQLRDDVARSAARLNILKARLAEDS